MLIKNISSEQVKRSGQLPFELGFHTDHRGMFTDINVHSILGIYVKDPIEQAQRRLSSQNKNYRGIYIEELLTKQLVAHNIFERINKLRTIADEHVLTAEQIEEYNSIDQTITKAMLRAETKLPKKKSHAWTSELGTLVHKLRYYRALLRQARGMPIHKSVVSKLSKLAKDRYHSFFLLFSLFLHITDFVLLFSMFNLNF